MPNRPSTAYQRTNYAQQRRGRTLFCIDSNGGKNGIYDIDTFQQLLGTIQTRAANSLRKVRC
jgi:hypothetical protein